MFLSQRDSNERRITQYVIAVVITLFLYVSTYYAIVDAEPSGIFRVGTGPWPKTAIYSVGQNQSFGKIIEYSLDEFTHPFFAPINAIDRNLRPSHWQE